MLYFRGTKDIKLEHTALALGKFDGLHKGHQYLFDELKKYKEKYGYQTVIFTFDFHPSNLFSGKRQPLIYTTEERRSIIEKMGIDVLIEYPFTQETAHMLPEEFVKKVLVENLDAKLIVVGDDFRFGYKRSGDVGFLKGKSAIYGYRVDDCEKVRYNDEIISASYVRECISRGDMELVAALLGRAYSITGKVISGRANGRKVAMPTANLSPDEGKLLPPEGVYASVIHIQGDDKAYYALTNIGCNPTVSDDNLLRVETHVLDYSGDLYGKNIEVELYLRLRGEKKFANLLELKEQVDRDRCLAEEFFKRLSSDLGMR